MSRFSPVPQFCFREVTDISSGFLEQLGIKFLMIDLDNTVAAYDESVPAEDVVQWISAIKSSGVELFVISNSRRKNRVESLSGAIGVGFIMQSRKPSSKGLFKAMKTAGFEPEASALAGDQVFTDAIAANLAGVTSIIVRPRRFTNPFLALRYYIEKPFRAMCKNKGEMIYEQD